MQNVIYNRNGFKVEVLGSVLVRLPDGRIVDRYEIHQIDEAIDMVDEMVAKAA